MTEWRRRPPFDVTLELGQACDFPFHVFTAPHLLLHQRYTIADAIRETIRIGGENANRYVHAPTLRTTIRVSHDNKLPPS